MIDLEKEKKKEYNKKYYQDNKNKIIEQQKEYCKINKQQINKQKKEYYQNNKEQISEKQKKYCKINKEKISEKRKKYHKKYYLENNQQIKQYRLNNKQQINEKNKEYIKNRKATDVLFKLKCNIGDLIRISIRSNGYTKQSKTFEILGCTYEEFKQHIERQFIVGMNWDNRKDWHLDHIYPVSLAKDEADLIKLNHYTNFQPLWALENIKKRNKVIASTQIKLI